MLIASLQLYLLARDGMIDRLEGGFFLAGLICFTAYLVWLSRRDLLTIDKGAEQEPPTPRCSFIVVVLALGAGIGLLVVGGNMLVAGAVRMAASFGVSESVIAVTVVAAGTSLPELATSAVASYRGHNDIAVANVIGSNIFNILGIIGLTSVVQPLEVSVISVERDLIWMGGAAVILFPLMRTRSSISRLEGAILLGGFALFLAHVLSA